ncbi:BREX-2 system adenine-specific DNA-methyltransferase PglX [Streptomyces sp. NPDC127072]|uniref:BREX-2 system adenine-specific DNA-methyltransferase PglX n=1 Tax=Streptomyces sp. NPDC127072 TaxID=3347129 RepID=UPI00365F89B5
MSAHSSGQDGLLNDLRKQVSLLEDDLRARSDSEEKYRDRLTEEYELACAAGRTAAMYETWRNERVTQAAAAWVLGCVFVRFCEDNGLIARPWLSGVGERLKDAEDHDAAFFAGNPEKNDRDWIIAAFDHLAGTNPAVAGLFDRAHNPLWEIAPSYEAATALLKFWRRVGPDGEIVHSFTDKDLDTRFLGDLYQELSEHARKTYALLQTPRFVEEFILGLTLEPAVAEFGLEPAVSIRQADGTVRELNTGLRTIDPACGSGHFLLGLFERLLKKWRDADKLADDWTLIRRALDAVHGCDKNPFAVAIARFRLLVAVLKAAGKRRLDTLGEFPINIAVGDSLLHAPATEGIQGDLFSSDEAFEYRTEDIRSYVESCDLLRRDSYHVVVANPPYIRISDEQERINYKKAYKSCHGEYFLTIPFAEQIFRLALRASGDERVAGFTGQITGNSFLKQKFGGKLIEDFLPTVDLSIVVDASGVQIPGHPTPTVILAGRNRIPRQNDPIRVTYRVRDEPTRTDDPTEGIVWPEIAKNFDNPGFESRWIGVEDVSRKRLARHPWVLSGGEIATLRKVLEDASKERLAERVKRCGFFGDTHADEAFTLTNHESQNEALHSRISHRGEHIRDWGFRGYDFTTYPYTNEKDELKFDRLGDCFVKHFWPFRSALWSRTTFGGKTYRASGRMWWEWHQLPKDSNAHSWAIVHAEVSTHNHFTLARHGTIFNRSAPVTKLPRGASEEEHISLLALLNSSIAAFWFRQVNQPKSGGGLGRGVQDEAWEERYGFRSGNIKTLPVPSRFPLTVGRHLDSLAQELCANEPATVCDSAPPTRAHLSAAHDAWTDIREKMIALQEELDWDVYHSYGLLTEDEKAQLTGPSPTPNTIPQVKLGERAFEIVLARKQVAEEIETAWFNRHGSTPVTEIPTHWPKWYQGIVQARIDIINARLDIGLIERPEYKRRWATDPWNKREKTALRTWLLDRCGDRSLWFHLLNEFEQPRTLTANQLADELETQPDAEAILRTASLYAAHLGKPNLSLTQVLQEIVGPEHVPFLAAYRYMDSGLRKRSQWEEAWDHQRQEDRTGEPSDIKLPPDYTKADFTQATYWANRGKLDVSKERFVSYPDANPDSDPTLLLGWAGWDQRDQATALLNIVAERRKQQGWSTERLVPLLAGIAELMPWLRQWFGEVDEEWGEESAADEFQSFLDGELAHGQLTPATLTDWRPVKKSRVRKATATAKATATTAMKKAAEDDE